MPLSIEYSENLALDPGAFNADGLAVVNLMGGRYSNGWTVKASLSADSPSIGEFRTPSNRELASDPRYPWRAVETAYTWITGEAKRSGWRMLSFQCLNGQFGPGERPYFCLARAVLGNERFKPLDGVTYADQMTLNEAMGYGA